MLPVLLLLLALALWATPGYVLSRWILPTASPLERVATSIFLGIITVAPTAFLITILRQQAQTLTLIVIVSLGWTALGWLLGRWLPLNTASESLLELKTSRVLVLCAATIAAVLALSTTYYAMDTSYMWWHCPYLGSLYLMEDGSGGGITTWDPSWQQSVTNLFMHDLNPGFGLKPVLQQQRPGNMAYLVQPLIVMSNAGLVLALWCSDFLILSFAMLLGARYLRSGIGLLILSCIFLWGVRVLSGYQINENCIGLVLSMGMLHLLLRYDADRPALIAAIAAGVAAAHLYGVRPATLLLIPAVVVLCGRGLKRSGAFAAAFLFAALPWLIIHGQAWGDPFTHPAIEKIGPDQLALEGTFLQFQFYPLNFPLASSIMTGPDHPFPSLFKVPLEFAQAFGVPFLTALMVGLLVVWKERRLCTGLLLWAIPIPLGLMLIVQLDYQKISYMLLAMAPTPLLVAAAFSSFTTSNTTRAILAAVAVIELVLLPPAMRGVEFEVDERVHAYYTNRDDGRMPETKSDADAHAEFDWSQERERLTTPRFLPTGIRNLDFLWNSPIAGANLFRHARMAQVSKSTDQSPIDGPIIIWSALRPSGLEHQFVATTRKAPIIPPQGPLISSGSGGGYLYLLRFDQPAPTQIDVHLIRKNNTHKLHLKTSSDTVNESRYLSFLVVDPSKNAPGQPEITVNGSPRTLEFVTQWSLPNVYNDSSGDNPWSPQPRIITNYPWGLKWANGSFTTSPGTAGSRDNLKGFKPVCRDNVSTLLQFCEEESRTSRQCFYALVNTDDQLVAGRLPPPTGVIWTTQSGMWRPVQRTEKCWRQLMSRNLAASPE